MSQGKKTAAAPKKAKAPAKAPAVKAPVAKIDAAAEKAYAEAATKAVAAPRKAPVKAAAPKPAPAPVKAAPLAVEAAPVETPAAAPVETAAPVLETAPAETPALETPVLEAPVVEAPAAEAAPAEPVTPAITPTAKLKDTIMETVNTADITATAKSLLADAQARAKTVYAKGTEFAGEATEFTKANLEAVVESGKIFFAGAQELLKDNVATGKTVIETVTEDAKKVAAVKSPTELFQLQGEITRRNLDAVVAYGSKRTEAWVKLYNDAFAPISNRVSVAVEKVKTAA